MPDQRESPTPGEIERIRKEAYQLTQLAVSYACPLLIGRPPSVAQTINTASAVMAELGGQHYLISAAHVLDETRRMREGQKDVGWHLASHAAYVTLDPEERIVVYERTNDLLVLKITEEEAKAPGKTIYSPPDWPPVAPDPSEYVFVCGYPASERVQEAPRYWTFTVACIGGALDAVRPGVLALQFERTRWITYKDEVAPRLGKDLGGMSGGPIFAFRGMLLTLIGVVAEHSPSYDIMYAASLETVTLDRLAVS